MSARWEDVTGGREPLEVAPDPLVVVGQPINLHGLGVPVPEDGRGHAFLVDIESDPEDGPSTSAGIVIRGNEEVVMKRSYPRAATVLIVAFAACTSGGDRPSAEADLQAISDLRMREVAAAEAGSVDDLLAFRTDDFVAMPPGQPPVRGRADVQAFLQGMFDAVTVEETVTSEEVVVAGDLAYDRGTFTGTITMQGTGETVPADGKYLWIAERQPDGSWKYAVQMWSDNQPPPSR